MNIVCMYVWSTKKNIRGCGSFLENLSSIPSFINFYTHTSTNTQREAHCNTLTHPPHQPTHTHTHPDSLTLYGVISVSPVSPISFLRTSITFLKLSYHNTIYYHIFTCTQTHKHTNTHHTHTHTHTHTHVRTVLYELNRWCL